MSSTLRETGLPPWLFTPRMAVASGIGIAVVVILILNLVHLIGGLFGSLFDRTDLNSAPLCFAIRGPVAPGTDQFPTAALNAKRSAGPREREIADVRAAAAQCTLTTCPSGARERYRQAVRSYLMTRSKAASMSFSRYGEVGLSRARWIYDEEEDREIITGLRQRYGAGLFDIKTMVDGREDYIAATRMLLFASAQAFKPCVKE
jgi:hypothetical protein